MLDWHTSRGEIIMITWEIKLSEFCEHFCRLFCHHLWDVISFRDLMRFKLSNITWCIFFLYFKLIFSLQCFLRSPRVWSGQIKCLYSSNISWFIFQLHLSINWCPDGPSLLWHKLAVNLWLINFYTSLF